MPNPSLNDIIGDIEALNTLVADPDGSMTDQEYKDVLNGVMTALEGRYVMNPNIKPTPFIKF